MGKRSSRAPDPQGRMTSARHIIALLKSHLAGDDRQFLTVAMQIAALEARQGHAKLAQDLRGLIDEAKDRGSAVERTPAVGPVLMVQPKGELASLVSVRYSDTRLGSMILPPALRDRLERVIREQRQQARLHEHGLMPRRKILLVGPPGSGKTMTAAALAGELGLPLFTVLLEGVINKFMGETSVKLRLIFDAMAATRGIYFFDEFDALGGRRDAVNDVGEIRRVLNSFLQFLEADQSQSLIVAATNHPDLLDRALFRRFDDVIEYASPDCDLINRLLQTRLVTFSTKGVHWLLVAEEALGLSQAEVVRVAEEAAKIAVLDDRITVTDEDLSTAISERKAASS
jgi:hypothetical protein